MPKSYSEQERAYIVKRLKQEAALSMARYGIRRTTVDELVKKVNIPKGTFYLFYKSKELLLFDVILEEHEYIDNKMCEALDALDRDTLTPKKLADVIFDFFRMAEEMAVLKLLNSEEMELLIRKLPKELVKEHLSRDTDIIERVFSKLPVKKKRDSGIFRAAFHQIYFATLHRKQIDEKEYEKALYTLVYGVVLQMF